MLKVHYIHSVRFIHALLNVSFTRKYKESTQIKLTYVFSNKSSSPQGVRRVSDVSAPIPTIPLTKNAAPIASFAPIQKNSEVGTTGDSKTETQSESVETKPTVTIPPATEQDLQKQPTTPTVTSPSPPQTPATSAQSPPPAPASVPSKDDLKAVHDAPATPPVGKQPAPKGKTTKK